MTHHAFFHSCALLEDILGQYYDLYEYYKGVPTTEGIGIFAIHVVVRGGVGRERVRV